MKRLWLQESDVWAQRQLMYLLGVSVLFLTAILFNHPLDQWIEDQLYIGNGIWVLEKSIHTNFYFMFYKLPKMLLIAGGVGLLATALWHFKNKRNILGSHYLLTIFAMGALPAFISFLKNISQVPCPHNLLEYGGTELSHSAIYFLVHRNSLAGQCFPAGHASGGFTLLGLIFLTRTRREAGYAIALSLVFGWVLGWYQQARGAHFLSHTITTQVLTLSFILLIYKLFYRPILPHEEL
jgi:membrane-associated PAP2 superfamily phosphatase